MTALILLFFFAQLDFSFLNVDASISKKKASHDADVPDGVVDAPSADPIERAKQLFQQVLCFTSLCLSSIQSAKSGPVG